MSSSSFERAVSWVGTSQVSTSNETKLRLYALFKVASSSPLPPTSRPGIFDFTGRAKWDAWSALGKAGGYEGEEGKERARREYEDEARKLGWRDAEARMEGEGAQEVQQEVRKEKNEQMVAVSVLGSDFVDEAPLSRLHELSLDGDAAALEAFLDSEEGKIADLDERDAYGFAPLHLAVDRGNLEAAKALLTAGADKSLPDSDGNTPLDLARLAEQDDLVALLS
ncbi:hypothetical protein JCM10207_001734 [Rhodosporidiobolus poonsookiae]